ncbi:MAG: hypothetical protein ACK5LS_00455 [Propioniciclava sp.]
MRPTLTVLWREPGMLQIGLDPDRSAVLTGCPPEADRVARLLAAGRTPADVAALSPQVDPTWTATTAREVAAINSLPRATPTPRVLLLGSSPIADACAPLLLEAGARIERPVTLDDALSRPAGPTVVLVAHQRVEPDRGVLAQLTRAGLPHLIVRTEAERTVVGPFVEVGRDPCQQCLDLTRRDLDPRWPHLLAQLCRMVTEPDPSHTAWAAATAVSLLRSRWAGSASGGGITVELDRHRHSLATRTWRHHPSCSCQDL